MKKKIPRSVVGRLTKYLTQLQVLHAAGQEWVFSHDLAESLDLTSSTVRQDLTHLDFRGVAKKGYQVCGLLKVLSRELGADMTWNMAVIGAGNLGRALALHEEFQRRGFNICGIFDSDDRKIGRKLRHMTVRHMRELPEFVRQRKIDIGVIAVPAGAAQQIADLLVASGIKGLLNLALTHLIVPKHVPVFDSRIVHNLQELAHAIIRLRK